MEKLEPDLPAARIKICKFFTNLDFLLGTDVQYQGGNFFGSTLLVYPSL